MILMGWGINALTPSPSLSERAHFSTVAAAASPDANGFFQLDTPRYELIQALSSPSSFQFLFLRPQLVPTLTWILVLSSCCSSDKTSLEIFFSSKFA